MQLSHQEIKAKKKLNYEKVTIPEVAIDVLSEDAAKWLSCRQHFRGSPPWGPRINPLKACVRLSSSVSFRVSEAARGVSHPTPETSWIK
ncbi:hypothetical protein J6590_042318 [Homalodisca vitripennis]|nr:hypothetical protein J6590_042318 [Homalodisca vitripennis]